MLCNQFHLFRTKSVDTKRYVDIVKYNLLLICQTKITYALLHVLSLLNKLYSIDSTYTQINYIKNKVTCNKLYLCYLTNLENVLYNLIHMNKLSINYYSHLQ